MKKAHWLSTILVLVLMFAAAYMMSRPTAEAYSQAAQIGSDEAPQHDDGPDAGAIPFSPNSFPGTQPVYFSPSDNDGTATVVIVYNTTAVTQTAYIQGLNSSGSLTVNSEIPLNPYERKFLISDSLAAGPPPSWQNNLLTNFTDFSTVGVLFVPAGVYFDGFIVFNFGADTIDPRADQGGIPLHFSTDPLTVLLPVISNVP
ncbi:MAG: hypothetical protein IPM39_24685 [Chloroflexi bacterium]|nr:hypothetical protein [Chloroflexota bacterium]